MKTIRFAVVGCGYIGKRHAEMINRDPHAQLVGTVDILKDIQLTDQDGRPVPHFTALEDFLKAGIPCDVVNICTPNGLHASQAIQAIRSNKHVVIEKPLALSRKEAEDVLFEALRHNVLVFGVMQNRYSPPSRWLKEMVDSGRLGRIYSVHINCFWNRDQRYYTPGHWHGTADLDGGTLFTQFSHFIDIMFWLFGDIRNIRGHFADFAHQHLTDFEDTGVITFEFDSGALGTLSYSTAVWDKNLESSLTIIAEKGSIKVGGQYMEKVEYCHVKDYSFTELPPTNPGNDYGHYKGSAQNHNYVIENIVQVLNGSGHITTNALEGLKVVDIIERIYALRPREIFDHKQRSLR
jgi:predicted dehydrogenase